MVCGLFYNIIMIVQSFLLLVSVSLLPPSIHTDVPESCFGVGASL